MKVVVRKSVRLDIPQVLAFVAACPGEAYSAVVIPAMRERFGCQTRAVQDALGILVAGGWLEREDVPTDRRRKIYRVTEHGQQDLVEIDGWRKMRWARWRYSSTSTRTRRRRVLLMQ